MYRAENIGSSSGVQSQSIHMDTKGDERHESNRDNLGYLLVKKTSATR